MGDISEMRGLIVIFVVIAVSITLILAIPSDFYTPTLTNPQIGGNVSPADLLAWNTTMTLNLTSGFDEDFTLNGFNWKMQHSESDNVVWLYTRAEWWIFTWDHDFCRWYDSQGIDRTVGGTVYPPPLIPESISVDTIDQLCSVDGTATLTAQNSKTKITLTLTYNASAYVKFSDALDAGEAYASFNSDWDDRMTSINALSLIGMLFTATLPNIDPTLNLIIAFGMWACTGYLVFIFALRVVGAVFGGGGA
jgi:hypothetical protein